MSEGNIRAARRSTEFVSKVPPVVFMFWVIKILATTVGETGGDAVSMTLNLGYAVASMVFLAFFAIALVAQVGSKRYHPFFYWALVVATTTVGTTVSDYLDRTLGLGYVKSSIMLFCGVLVVLFLWHRSVGKVRFENITSRKEEIFYWVTILVSNTLGTALGDFVATTAGLGFERGAVVFAGLIAIIAALHYFAKSIPPAVLFWAAYVLTRPLGATLGDSLTKSHTEGGLGMGRFVSSLGIGLLMAIGIALMTRRTARISGPAAPA
jgi:uncharacterized membrane-anchored protein